MLYAVIAWIIGFIIANGGSSYYVIIYMAIYMYYGVPTIIILFFANFQQLVSITITITITINKTHPIRCRKCDVMDLPDCHYALLPLDNRHTNSIRQFFPWLFACIFCTVFGLIQKRTFFDHSMGKENFEFSGKSFDN
ncbi:MAG: hypothetical protein GY761_17110 [Hyphomicrobiales bacterium]|nr:hypothetical protein [Hyphomicrobiales bacterium]